MSKRTRYRGQRRKNGNQAGQAPAAARKKSRRRPDTSRSSSRRGDVPAKRKRLRRWQKVLLGIAGPTIATAIGLPLATLGEKGVGTLPRVTQPAPTPSHHGSGSGEHPGRGNGSAFPNEPLRTIFALPIDPSGNMTWAFAQGLVLSGSQRAEINQLAATGQSQQLYNFLYRLGGYLISADTRFLVQNRSSYTIAVENIETVGLSCQAPLTGTLLEAPEQAGAEPSPQLGAEVGSGDDSVMAAPGPNVRAWQADPFSIPLVIPPDGTYYFDVRAVALTAACIFQYQITEVVNGTTITQPLSYDVFRVSALAPDYRPKAPGARPHVYPGYQYVYVGGTADPQWDGNLVQLYPPS